MATYYVDFENGSDANNGTTFALRKRTIASLTGATAGDTIRVMADYGVVKTRDTTTFTNKSATVTLASARTQNIYNDGAWTASTNVTCTATTTYRKLGSNAAQQVFAAGFTTGKAAYYATGVLDLSGYTGISFWFYSSAAVAANTFRIDLCSDTLGATPVDSFTINEALVSNYFHQITLFKGSALGSNINSIALYCLLDPGTPTVAIDNVIAVNTNDLHLGSLVGKYSEKDVNGIGLLYPIRSINGTTITLDAPGGYAAATNRGYSGTTETTSMVIYEPIRVPALVSSGGSYQNYAGAAGTAGSPVTISGGWNRTDMSTQTGRTVVSLRADDTAGNIPTLFTNASNRAYLKFENLGATRSVFFSANTFPNVHVVNCGVFGIYSGSSPLCFRVAAATTEAIFDQCVAIGGNTGFNGGANPGDCVYSNLIAIANSNVGMNLALGGNSPGQNVIVTDCTFSNNLNGCTSSSNFTGKNITISDGTTGIILNSICTLYNITLTDNTNTSLSLTTSAGGTKIYGYTSSGATNGISLSSGAQATGLILISDATISDTTIYSGLSGSPACAVKLHRRNGSKHVNERYEMFGTIKEQNTVAPGSGVDYAWEFAVSVTGHRATIAARALGLSEPFLYAIPCKANVTTTISMQVRTDHADHKFQFRVFGGRYPGIGTPGTDITVDATPSVINTWQTKSISVTPTEDCVIDLFVLAYNATGGTTRKGWIAGPVTITQA